MPLRRDAGPITATAVGLGWKGVSTPLLDLARQVADTLLR